MKGANWAQRRGKYNGLIIARGCLLEGVDIVLTMGIAHITHHCGARSVNYVAHSAIAVFHLKVWIPSVVDLQAFVFRLNARLDVCLPGFCQYFHLFIGPFAQVVLLELDVLSFALLVILTHMVAMTDFVRPVGLDAVRASQGGENGLQQSNWSCGIRKLCIIQWNVSCNANFLHNSGLSDFSSSFWCSKVGIRQSYFSLSGV